MIRTLLVDTNRAAYPIYQALINVGHEVWVVGSKPTDPLAKLSPNYLPLDYADVDRLADVVRDQSFDYLVPGCTDLSYRVCAAINPGHFPGLDTPATTLMLNNKLQFRNFALEQGLSVPRLLSYAEAMARPSVIIKPTDAFSGRGIQVLHAPTKEQLSAAFALAQAASSTNHALIEEYVTGQLYSHSALLNNQYQIVADFFVREDCYAHPFAVDISCVSHAISADIRHALRTQIEHLASVLDLTEGLIHTQFILQDDRFWMIEVTRRCPGDLYALLIELTTGYPYAANYVAPFLGASVKPVSQPTVYQPIIRHTVTARDGLRFWGLQFARSVEIRLWVSLATAGDILAPAPAGRAAIVFLQADSDFAMHDLYQNLLAGKLYTFDSPPIKKVSDDG